MEHKQEISSGKRFEFGENWRLFIETLDEDRIATAVQSLKDMLGCESLVGKRFLDIGSGSGLFSLAAHKLGAQVHSFDYDPQSVACTELLRQRYGDPSRSWTIESGSALDEAYLEQLGTFEIVYSWGVLHHTGAMWQALANAAQRVASGGKLFISIYNDQGVVSKRWLKVKKLYNRLPNRFRWLVLWPAFLKLWYLNILLDILHGRPGHSWRSYGKIGGRGMSPWRDVVDWVGGLPFEVAKPEEIFSMLHKRGFQLEHLYTCGGGHGCNQFVFTYQPLLTSESVADKHPPT